MSAVPYVVGGALLVGGIIYLRSRKQAAADPCDQLGDPKLVLACKAARFGLGAIGQAFTSAVKGEDRGATNTALNGPVTEWFDEKMMAAGGYGGANGYVRPVRYTDARGPQGQKYIAQHANGCEPHPAAPGWSKCAPGTQAMTSDAYIRQAHAAGELGKAEAATGSGDPMRDPLTFRWEDRPNKNVTEFPLPVPAGSTAYVYRGRPLVCAAGTQVSGRDHRAQPGPACVATSTVDVPKDAHTYTGPSGTRGDDCASAGPEYIWDPTINACRRRRVGESPSSPSTLFTGGWT